MSAQAYSFAVNSYTIRHTRSLHLDTNYVSATVAVDGQPPISKTVAMGNQNDGTFSPGISLDGIQVDDAQSVAFSYAILNSGFTDQAKTQSSLEGVVQGIANAGVGAAATAIGGAVNVLLPGSGVVAVPIVGAGLKALAGFIENSVFGLVFPNCDGPVAAGLHIFTGATLRSGKTVRETETSNGTDSPSGCGSNSIYDVTWSVVAPPTDACQSLFTQLRDVQQQIQDRVVQFDDDIAGPPPMKGPQVVMMRRELDKDLQPLNAQKAAILSQLKQAGC